MQSVLIVDDVHEILMNGLIVSGFDVHYRPDLEPDQIASFSAENNISGLIVRSKIFVDEIFLAKANMIEWIGRAGAGMDNIDELAANRRGVFLMNSENANSNAVGEQAISMLLALYTRIIKSNVEVRNGIWNREGNRGLEFAGKTVGIIGYGNTGSAFAKKLAGFDVKVLAYDKYKSFQSDQYVECSDLQQIFHESDVLALHIPLTEETNKMVNLEFISKFRKPFILMNLSRGNIVDPYDLDLALSSGKITGFVSDVWNTEPPWKDSGKAAAVFEKWKNNDRVIFTPHVAGWTVESYEIISEVLLRNIKKYKGLE